MRQNKHPFHDLILLNFVSDSSSVLMCHIIYFNHISDPKLQIYGIGDNVSRPEKALICTFNDFLLQ